MYKYVIKNIRVVDGDTIDCDIDLGFDTWMLKQRIRLFGINTPEVRTKDLEEKKKGIAAKQFVQGYIDIYKDREDYSIILESDKYERGKFGRILGTISVICNLNSTPIPKLTQQLEPSLNWMLLKEGHAVEY